MIRRSVTSALVAVLGLAPAFAGPAAPAQAAVPAVAQTYTKLMYRSLTVTAEAAKLRGTLATQEVAFTFRARELGRARSADTAAQARLTRTTTAHSAARSELATARTNLTTAKKALNQVSGRKPRSAATLTQAKAAVTAATAAVDTRATQVKHAATARRNAQAAGQTAATGLDTAVGAWRAASAAIRGTQQRIDALGTAAGYAGQAAALSRDVVTQVRAVFALTDTTVVYGVTVHKSVAFAFQRMLDDAKADGITMSGGGFRTTQRQIELRKINGCPDIWTAPASSCRVPTAIPGRSLHEIGLAIDITSGGRTLTAKSPAFLWLTQNAAEYGFVNLPSEAWHWSITGG